MSLNRIVHPLELTAAERLNRSELPGLKLVHENLTREIRLEINSLLERSCTASFQDLSCSKFGPYCEKLEQPGNLHLFKMSPLPGQGLISLSSTLTCAFIEAMLGGKLQNKQTQKIKQPRELSSLENRLLGRIVLRLLDMLKEAWHPILGVNPTYARCESNPLGLSLCSPSDKVAVVYISLDFGQQSGSISFCYPFSMLEPVKSKLASALQKQSIEKNSQARKQLTHQLLKVSVELRARLGNGRIKGRALLNLKPGDIIPLDTPAGANAVINIGGKDKFEASEVSQHSCRTLKIIRALN